MASVEIARRSHFLMKMFCESERNVVPLKLCGGIGHGRVADEDGERQEGLQQHLCNYKSVFHLIVTFTYQQT